MKRMILMLAALVAIGGFAIAGSPSCDHGEAGANEHHAEGNSCAAHGESASCPMKDKKVAEAKEVTLEGKLLCRHCNLHQTNTCEKVFQTAGTETLLPICAASDLKSAEAVSEYGNAVIVVTGTLMKTEDGTELLRISSAKKKA